MTDRHLRADAAEARRREAGQPRPDLRAQIAEALGEASRTNPCSCGSKNWAMCFHPGAPSHEERRADAVLAIVQPLHAQLQFLHALLALSSRIDLGEQLMLHTDGQKIHAAVNISDVFWWGGADSEDVTPETLPALEQAYVDLRAVDPYDDMYTAELYAARRRGMRPQGAAYPKERAATQALFDACGPQRPTGLGNPRKPPAPKEPS